MHFIAPLIGAALLSGLVSGLPRPQDSAVGAEVGVSAPDGVPITDSVELSSQLASETGAAQKVQATAAAAGNYGAGAYGGAYGAASSANQWSSEAVVTSTSAAWSAYSTPIYGSGQSNWGSGYDDCVSQCLAKFGAPAAAYVPTVTSGSSGSSGNGATHTIIVAPSQGVLRYVPFAVNASVGDTIKFMWGANNHTVTKSSALEPCNNTKDALFASGAQNKDFVFTQVVNDTNPVFFHCAVPNHCKQGMFGVINPASSFGSPDSLSAMMQTLGGSNPDIAAYASYTTKQTANNLPASKWGGNFDLAAIPGWAHASVAENVLFTRNFLAANTEVLKEDGSIDLSGAGSTPLMIPQDVSAALNNAAVAAVGTSATSSPSSTASQAPAPTGETESQTQGNGASSLPSPRGFVALFVVVATFFVL